MIKRYIFKDFSDKLVIKACTEVKQEGVSSLNIEMKKQFCDVHAKIGKNDLNSTIKEKFDKLSLKVSNSLNDFNLFHLKLIKEFEMEIELMRQNKLFRSADSEKNWKSA